MEREKIRELIAKMTLEEKANLCSGADFWHTESLERLGIPASMVSDGPHGLRKQDQEGDHLGVNDSITAVCFPAGCATAASFDTAMIGKLGETLGECCQAEDVSVILGPAINIKRSPLCGRNFEYYSEDPYLAGKMAAAYINGVQSKHIGTSVKHYMGNNQETRRLSVDAKIDERTLREIYLPAFEEAVKGAKPWTVMASYNKVNGEHVSESKKFLTDILRDEWGFDGYVVSDWGAVCDRVQGIRGGMDLEMPASHGLRDELIVRAVKDGSLDEALVDKAVENILNIVYRYQEHRDPSAVFDREKDHQLSGRIARECIVLLKNEGVLPIDFKRAEKESVAFIGKFSKDPRFQGGGSSHITCYQKTGAFAAAKALGFEDKIIYAKGYEDDRDVIDETLMQEAVEAAKKAKVAVIFAGLPDAFESEGFDRKHMRMPDCQNRLIEEVAKVQPNVIVVLHNGSPVEMPWVGKVKGIVESYLGGENVGTAQMEILSGMFNPCAKLPETFPKKLSDNPSYLNFPGVGNEVEYKEGIFVGYRYYEKKEMDVLFPFGHGLSYTQFTYSDLKIDKDRIREDEPLTVTLKVTNSGSMAGSEVVQLYVSDKESRVVRPVKELKGFAKIFLDQGESKEVSFTLDQRAFSYYETAISDWFVESGEFEILVGASSSDIRLQKTVYVEGTKKLPVVYDLDSTMGDVLKDPRAAKLVEPIRKASTMEELTITEGEGMGAGADEMATAMEEFAPLRNVLSFGNGTMTPDRLQEIVDEMNRP
ncbi:MAG: glycoside hydrolase family 3 C-terminal domain-containing protein [Lachnospiraceae bacterium]|nr:glycoside hydrolase family 3 C-terminal domain-containing protein [Lachnospiraceae bacterium]